MKTHRFIRNIRRRDVGRDLLDQLLSVAPEGVRFGGEFELDCEEKDSRINVLIDIIKQAGLTPVPITYYGNGFVPGKHYITGRIAKYEESDFDESRYISLRPGFSPRLDEENILRTDPPIRLLMGGETARGAHFASTNFDHLLADAIGRELLERIAAIGASFVPAHLVHPDTHNIDALKKQIEEGSTPNLGDASLWEVRPTVVLPPMLPMKYKHFVDREERLSRNPIDVDRRMAYARADLDRVGPFDFARPDPSEDPTKALVNPYVVSQRVFQLMKKQKGFKIDQWTPVREE